MDKVRIVLVGIGGYGGTFLYELLDTKNEKIELMGLVDPHPERSARLEEIRERNIPVYDSMDAFYREKKADLAVICTPIFLHTKNILTALENGSNVLCEKPLCGDAKDIDIINAASAKSGKFVYIGYQWAYSEAVTKLKEDRLSGKFGELIEMKSLVLRPRTRAYFGRGVGWAGKITAPDGSLVYDSIANNSAAHYLFDMVYLMGDYGKAIVPEKISSEILRANNIENFDTSLISLEIDGGKKALFIGAHPVEHEVGPLYKYTFEKGCVYFAVVENKWAKELIPEEYLEYGNIVAIMNDGEKKVYGDPNADVCRKMYMAVDAILSGREDNGVCGVDAAGVHTRIINEVQEKTEILDINEKYIKERDDVVYADGLFEKLVSIYENPEDASILSFR